MSLFEVPGWQVLDAAVPGPSSNKKRKRRNSWDTTREEARDLDSLYKKVQSAAKAKNSANKRPKKADKEKGDVNKRREKRTRGEGAVSFDLQARADKGKDRARNGPALDRAKDVVESEKTGAAENPTKKQRQKKSKGRGDTASQKPINTTSPPLAKESKKDAPEGLTAFQANMKHSLDGAKFRWINETLYKSDSAEAHEMMRENPAVFSEYHTGFRHQVESWPVNPVSHYISTLSSRPIRTVIVDLGCGDAALARELVPLGLVVLSFDLVSDNKFVVEADICSRIPLPGSEVDQEDPAQIADVVVCALSLMSKNWVGCVREAWRILKLGGELKIAEVASRFTNVDSFISLVSDTGFKLQSKDDSNTHFTLFDFVKIARKKKSDKDWDRLTALGSVLKPCEYKRR